MAVFNGSIEILDDIAPVESYLLSELENMIEKYRVPEDYNYWRIDPKGELISPLRVEATMENYLPSLLVTLASLRKFGLSVADSQLTYSSPEMEYVSATYSGVITIIPERDTITIEVVIVLKNGTVSCASISLDDLDDEEFIQTGILQQAQFHPC